MMVPGDAALLGDSLTARSLIRDRESRLKKNLARIDNQRAQELWNGDSGSAQLEFRWLISQRLLGDILIPPEVLEPVRRQRGIDRDVGAGLSDGIFSQAYRAEAINWALP
jgi:hypothetical protein